MEPQKHINQGSKNLNFSLLTHKVKKLFKKESSLDFDSNKIKRKLAVNNPRTQIDEIIKNLLKEEFIVVSGRGKYIFNGITKEIPSNIKVTGQQEKSIYTGIVDKTKTGSAYIIIKELHYDVFIPNRHMMTAMDGDTVKVELLFSKMRNKKDGKIIEIISRAKSQFIGTYRSFSNYSTVFVEGIKDEIEIFLPIVTGFEIKDGDKALVEISEWRGKVNPVPWGKLISVLADEDQNEIEMKSILINNGFSIDFPQDVKHEAELLDKTISIAEIGRRKDFRDVITFTIDPDTAKDFDDALSYRTLENGNLEIGVHIADVSHFVKPGSKLDAEALKRSTSVYLVDRVAPMLPEELSNELCSLRPDEESLTFSSVFEFSKNNEIINRWFGKTIIHSDKRFTYEEAQEIINKGEGKFVNELQTLNNIAKNLRKLRFQHGSIDFSTDEVKFILDEKGNPVDLYVKERLDTHMLVEEFMLLANKEVATYIVKKPASKKIPFVFRIHDLPDPDKLMDFAAFAKDFGLKLKLDTPNQVVKSFNDLNKRAETDERISFLIPLALRTMAKAIYSTDNIGHFGLGFDNYTHFTSPIRRYSDVLVHRILEKNLNEPVLENKGDLEEKCRHISEQERKAVNAERESTKYKQVQYISGHEGEIFEGLISGFIEKGMFVELKDNKVEGMVEFKNLGQYFVLNEAKNRIIGSKDGNTYKIGDTVIVKVRSTDLVRRRVDFEMTAQD
ncbi:MAG: ribonuclease R [Saprospiraceae bacterium]|nr:ribonuclease R [Saprospiraceae bacterium]